MNVGRFLTQDAAWERMTGEGYDGPSYDPPQMIKVRWHHQVETVITIDSVETASSAHISTLQELQLGDRVTDAYGTERKVIQVRANYDTRGGLSHYVGWLR